MVDAAGPAVDDDALVIEFECAVELRERMPHRGLGGRDLRLVATLGEQLDRLGCPRGDSRSQRAERLPPVTTPCADLSSMVAAPIRAVQSSYSYEAASMGYGSLSARFPDPSGSNTITQTSATGVPAVGNSKVSRNHSACGRSGWLARM